MPVSISKLNFLSISSRKLVLGQTVGSLLVHPLDLGGQEAGFSSEHVADEVLLDGVFDCVVSFPSSKACSAQLVNKVNKRRAFLVTFSVVFFIIASLKLSGMLSCFAL